MTAATMFGGFAPRGPGGGSVHTDPTRTPWEPETIMHHEHQRAYDDAPSLQRHWDEHPRWQNIRRPYQPQRVMTLRSSLPVDHTWARHGAHRLWEMFGNEPFVRCLSALTGSQAIQQVDAGLEAIYISGWQVAGMPTPAAKSIPTRVSIPSTPGPDSSNGSTGRSPGPTRSRPSRIAAGTPTTSPP